MKYFGSLSQPLVFPYIIETQSGLNWMGRTTVIFIPHKLANDDNVQKNKHQGT